ncbi:MAG: DUF1638 domain-containing protein [Kiloniellaceae bacterium]
MTALQPPDVRPPELQQERTLLIACGALAREIVTMIRVNAWRHLTVSCLPASWHNTPDKIPEGVRRRIREARGRYDHILVLYGDCGTGGQLDEVLAEEGVERIAGPHCYSFFAGNETFDAMAEAEPAAFYLTDYLIRHFDRLIIKGLGLDRHPQLLELYFGNYRKLVYLAQTEDDELQARARAAAERLGLDYDYRFTGYGGLGRFIDRRIDLEEIREQAEAERPEVAAWLS